MAIELPISIIMFLLSAVWMVSCAVRVPAKPVTEERVAVVEVTDRRANGQFDTPDKSPFGGAAVIKKRWQYEDENGRTFFGKQMNVAKPNDAN